MSLFFEVERMVGPVDGGLQVSNNGVNPGKARHVRALATFADNFTLLDAPGLMNDWKHQRPSETTVIAGASDRVAQALSSA